LSIRPRVLMLADMDSMLPARLDTKT
jgi:hypothetical protein